MGEDGRREKKSQSEGEHGILLLLQGMDLVCEDLAADRQIDGKKR